MTLAPLAAATSTHLRPLDLAIVGVYLLGITLFGLRFRRRTRSGSGAAAAPSRSLQSYFLADNTIPWWAIALSIVSAETSTLTIISIPGVAFTGDFGFLQIVLGYLLGRVVVALLFLPRYFSGRMLTAYQLIDRRFGSFLHKVTAALFLLTRAAAEGVRVFAVSIVVGLAIGTGDTLSIAIISLLTLLYTFEGGMAAVIWTDVVQMALYLAGTLVAVYTLGTHVPGGWTTIHHVAGAAGKFHLFNFALDLTTAYTFWAGILGGTFLTMASHGTDQLMVQRMLSARSLRESRLALLSSGVVIFIQFTLFLLIGAGLYVFYGASTTPGGPLLAGLHPAMSGVANSNAIHGLAPDRIFPTFIVREMPLGIAGLLVAAILAAAMSNLSAALNSLASTTVVDFYMHLRPNAAARERDLISKSSTVLWAIVLFAIAVYSITAGGKGHVVEIGLSIASVAYGCLLGVFLLGTLTRFATERGTALAMVCGFALNLWLWQGTFPVRLGPLTIPHIAFTWYVLIGALVTFALGSLFSLVFRKQSKRTAALLAAILLLPFWLSSRSAAEGSASPEAAAKSLDFSQVSSLLNDAIANHHLPGAVVLIGHDNKIVFEHAYGNRKLAGEPGLDGVASPAGPMTPAEPMTIDTIFDMASLTKCLATATAVMQLYEQGKIASFDDPVERYLPAFNESHDPTRAKVTLRMLLTHTSGEAPDVDLRDPWGLEHTDRAEGFRRAMTTPLKATPGSIFTYSDINFILLGDLVETLSGQREDVYAREHIFQPLGMTETRYLPIDKACSSVHIVGAAIAYSSLPEGVTCAFDTWSGRLLARIAPTAHDNEGTAATNPDFDHLLRGTVHDPTTRRMGGVAGHAGVFSTAHDVSLFASALLEKLLHNTGAFPLKQSTLQLMTQPEQPGHNPEQIPAANAAEAAAFASEGKSASAPFMTGPHPGMSGVPGAGPPTQIPGLAPHYPAIPGQNLRGYGWDIDTAFSKPRGAIFPIGSFGHTGFTGTSLWMDPASDTYVILLANAIHPRGNPPISNLRGQVATAAAEALGLGIGFAPKKADFSPSGADGRPAPQGTTLTGIDVLESAHFSALNGLHRLGLLTNQAGLDSRGRRTIDVLLANHQPLTTLFSPEHGLNTNLDTEHITNGTDPATHLPVISLYGAHDADRRPTHAQLNDLDAVLIDLQDAGVRFWTYEAATSYFLEAAATEQTQYHHDLQIILLDRPNPIGGVAVEGPISDPGLESYVNTMPLPVRHGLTLGELAKYIVANRHLATHLTVIPMQHWSRAEYFADTGLPWTNPSPNLRSPEAAIVYPALGLIETTNLSVGRGTSHPFSFFGAGIPPASRYPEASASGLINSQEKKGAFAPEGAWFNAADVAAALTARRIPGVTFLPTTEPIADDANHYPFHGQTIPAVRLTVTDPNLFDSPETGLEILALLHRLYPAHFHLERVQTLLCSRSTLDALTRGEDPRAIATTWQPALAGFRAAVAPYLLYR